MKILAQEFTALQTLKLWVEERNFAAVARSNETDAWIQEILRLRGLKDFEMPALVPKHTQYLHEQHLQCTSKVLPLLQSRLLQSNYEAPSDSLQRSPNISQAGGSFPFLKLPPEARALVYRHALLPANKRVHSYVEPWFDVGNRNTVPFLSTCRTVRQEAEDFLYGNGIFTVADAGKIVSLKLRDFFKIKPRLRAKIRYVLIGKFDGVFPKELMINVGKRMGID